MIIATCRPYILDRLNVRETARTSILSRRWTQLCAKLSRLIISAQHFLPKGVSCTDISDDELVRINEVVVQAIESILTRRNPGEHTICLLSTTFYLRDDVPISIGHAVGHAVAAHLVENVKFSVMTGKYDIIDMDEDNLRFGESNRHIQRPHHLQAVEACKKNMEYPKCSLLEAKRC